MDLTLQAPAAHAPINLKIVAAATLGTTFEWYDFFLYGSLAPVIAAKFFNGLPPTQAFIMALLAFSTGFMVRPFGAIVFGRIGDASGRKHAFLATILIMGAATFLVGALPTYDSIGVAAPIILISLRLLQGLALGGEYGGAATYVAEFAPPHKRGRHTSWIQASAAVGMLLSLLIILATRRLTGANFDAWGWRIPFLVSIALLAISLYVRLSMHESPAFQSIKRRGDISPAPFREAFGTWKNFKLFIVALFGISAGMSVINYVALFYPMFFLTQTLQVDALTVTELVSIALVTVVPMAWLFGVLSDKLGRKSVMVTGFLLALCTLFPVFKGLTHYANPALERAQQNAPIVVHADPKDCHVLFNPIGTRSFTSACDVARQTLAQSSATYTTQLHASDPPRVEIGNTVVPLMDVMASQDQDAPLKRKALENALRDALHAAGYPAKADPAAVNRPAVLALLIVLFAYATMIYAPVAAALVEMFPTRIRYTAMSLPYHLANGWIGGLLPPVAFALIAAAGNIYFGLWYPIFWAAVSVAVLLLFYQERKNVELIEQQ